MNENVSAGGGHQGSILAPPAVPDLKQTSLTSSSPVCNNSNICNYTSTAGTTSSLAIQTSQSKTLVASSNYQEAFTHQQRTLKNQYCAQENSQSSALMPQKSTNFTTVVTAVSNTHRNEISNCGDQSSGPPNTSNKKLDSDFSPPLTKKLKIANLEVNKNIAVTSLITNRNILPENKIKTTLTAGGLPTLKVKILKGKYQIKEDSSQKISEYAEEVLYLKTIGSMSEFGKSSPMQLVSISSVCNTDQVAYEKRDSPSNLKHHHQNVNVDREILTTGQPLNVFLSKNKTSQVSITKNESKGSLEPEIISSTAQTTSLSNSGIIIPASNEKNNTLPQGAEIKIPAIGATPVAVSTKLPAAVVQLTQQGGTPLVPCSTATGSTTLRLNDKNIHEPSSYITYNNAGNYLKVQPSQTVANVAQLPALVNNSDKSNVSCSMNSLTSGNSNAQEFSFKAKQEVYVMQRISELQREGLWAEKRLPKLQEPSRPKAHWDYLLEEMVWLAADFAQERKWKKNAAKKCSKMIQKYFLDKKNALNKAEKTQEAHLRRVAAFISKEIKMFWSNVEKLVEYKHHTKLEEKRKKALDQHLSFIVDQTEKFSQQLAEGMNKSVANTSTVPSLNSSKISSPRRDEINASDDEFKPDTASEDDEETIAKAEEDAADVNEEVAALEKESQMDLDDFIKDLPKGYLENRDKIVLDNLSENSEKDDSDAEFKAEEPSEDDEVTISKQEEEETDIDYKKEITELEADNDLTVEQLVAKYKSKALSRPTSGFCKQTNEDSEVDDEDEMLDSDDSCNSDDNSDEISSGDSTHSDSGEDEREEEGLQSLIDDVGPNNKDDIIKDATALAESIQPKGNTLSSTNVVTPVPFLLKHPLREYQHIGLDWLVTMNDRKLNGILADEMGLGKTIQTIALLAHLACVKGNWGPHLIVVPSSVILNWDMEFKKWCPGFKILTYYGTQKERKLKRVGWTKPNAFHVCITSYKLVIQDQQSFRRKKWKYLILDEAQNIKNFKSQRWQLLLNFSTERRLLLTGTPLQNDLMELWSLMHFLMPSVFSSHREFKEWFSNPMTGMIEGSMEYNESLINRLHKVIRPFLLRRLKKEVEKQMPKKYEHVIMCRLSNRQRYLYDDFMSHAKTKETLQTGNLLSVINVLMQLRKVCNHPNMFEVRPTISPFQMDGICFYTPRLVCDLFEYNPFKEIDLHTLNLLLVELEVTLTAYVSYRSRQLAAPKNVLEEVDSLPDPQPKCPIGKYKFRVRVHDHRIQENFSSANAVHVGASPKMKFEGNKIVPAYKLDPKNSKLSRRLNFINPIQESNHEAAIKTSNNLTKASSPFLITNAKTTNNTLKSSQERISNSINSGIETSADDAYSIGKDRSPLNKILKANNPPNLALKTDREKGESSFLEAFVQEVKTAEHSKKMSEINPKKRKILNEFCPEMDSVYKTSSVFQKRIQTRLSYLKTMSAINAKRVEAVPIYGSDCRESYEQIMTNTQRLEYSSWQSRSYLNCSTAVKSRDNWKLSHAIKSYEKRCGELQNIFKNFVFYVPSACAPRIKFFTQSLVCKRLQYEKDVENITRKEIAPKMLMLHPIISAMTTQFPDPRLIQYDCGKLQTLDKLLRQLKTDQHRVLIFTQMTKMLDILEAFLNYHGYIYLRLDGSTKVEQRQIHMERFNGDKRIFCFILSTRSGGVGINLTGADTVIFYDSDWNPTMDAQAQDRCHRIGQTRDVHIYRLVSEKTIEVNILRKANQKRMLSDMAIEGGNFTTSYFKSSTIKDLFNTEQQECELSTTNNKQEKVTTSYQSTEAIPEVEVEKQSLRVFENALAAAEDEQDVQATKVAKAEAAADLDEFDETIPITEDFNTNNIEMSKADKEVENLVKQLSPIERYAMRFVEETGAAWTAEQLRAAEEEIEAQKREWEANRLYALKEEEEMLKEESKPKEIITYHRKDANNQMWISANSKDPMPMWCPPSPPQSENDIYMDYSLSFMYDIVAIPETELPPVYIKRDYKRSRSDAGFLLDGSRRPSKIRREENFCAPRSLFDRPSASIARIRRDLKSQRMRGIFKPNIQIPGLKPQLPQKPLIEPEDMSEWCIFEDIAILHILINIQGLPCNLMLLSPGHTPNWDLVAEYVNFCCKTYRTPKQCRYRYETVIQPREEGKLTESPKKQKKPKTGIKHEFLKSALRHLRTTQMYINDNNATLAKFFKSRFDCIKSCYLKKAPPPKRHAKMPNLMNPKHMEVLQEFGIVNYDQPISPINIALMRANKMREKQRSQLPGQSILPNIIASNQQNVSNIIPSGSHQHQLQDAIHQQNSIVTLNNSLTSTPLQTHQVQIQHMTNISFPNVSSQPSPIVLQHASNIPQSHNHNSSSQSQAQITRTSLGNPTPVTQIVKAIVAPPSTVLTGGHMQQLPHQASITTSGIQHVQLQQPISNNLVGGPTSVSVVLTTPVQSLSSVVQNAQHNVQVSQASSATQLVSITPQTIVSNSSQVGNIMQNIPSQSLPQVVSVSQLTAVGTVLSSSSNVQQNTIPSGTTINTTALRAQRILTASSSNFQEAVLQSRATNLNPTIVSMANLGQGVASAQLHGAQLRFSSQVAKGVSIHQNTKFSSNSTVTGNPAHIQVYRQRHPVKVLQATTTQNQTGQAIVQSVNGQTTIVNTGATLIQGNLMQNNSVVLPAQKVSVASVSSATAITTPGVTTSVAAIQLANNQSRTPFIKQVSAKQNVTRQVGDTDMLLVKRQVVGSHQKAQVLQQGQIYSTTNQNLGTVQLQQQNQNATNCQQLQQQTQAQAQQVLPQQMATLVKTPIGASGVIGSASGTQTMQGTVNMTLSHLKPVSQIKMANHSQMRQLQMQQNLTMSRKFSRMTQLASVQQTTNSAAATPSQQTLVNTQINSGVVTQKSGSSGNLQTQLVHIQNTKPLSNSVTVQQIQQVMRQGQSGSLGATGLVLGKTSVGRVIPVSVSASAPNQRQTIQVVSASTSQALTSGSHLRAHVTSGQNLPASLKMTSGGNQQQNQQAIFTAIQQQTAVQQQHRQNASPVRLQTTPVGNVVTVVQQQQTGVAPNIGAVIQSSSGVMTHAQSHSNVQPEVLTINQAVSCAANATMQQTNAQNVRTLVKKKIMQIRSEKE